MKIFSLFCILTSACCLGARAQLPTNNIPPAAAAVMVGTNGVLKAPVNFFGANSNAILNVVTNSGGLLTNDSRPVNLGNAANVFGGTHMGTFIGNGFGLTNLNSTNLTGIIQSKQLNGVNLRIAGGVYTNNAGLGSPTYQVTSPPGVYSAVIFQDDGTFIQDADGNEIDYPGGILITTSSTIFFVDGFGIYPGQQPQNDLFPASTQNMSVSNMVVSGLFFADGIATVDLNVSDTVHASTVSANTLNGNLTGIADQIHLANYSFTNGFLPTHDSMMKRQMPVPAAMYSTYLKGATINATLITNMVNELVTNGIRDAGVDWIEIDDFWQQTNVIRVNGSPALTWNTNFFPQGISAAINYAHANGIKVMLYTSYGPSQTNCGGTYKGERMSSQPGTLTADFTGMASWGLDGGNVDTCGFVASTEQDLRNMYVEIANAVSFINSQNSPAPGRTFPTRVGNLTFAATQYNWQAVEANIVFEGGDWGQTSPIVDLKNWLTVYTNSWITGPGHYYTIENLPDGAGLTNALCNDMSMMAVLPSPMLIANISAASIPYYTNAEIWSIYKDSLCAPGVLVSNTAAGMIWARPLSNVLTKAVAFVNTNVTTQSLTVNSAQCGITAGTPFNVRDIWAHTDLGTFTNSWTHTAPASSARLFVLTANATSPTVTTGTITLTNFPTMVATNAAPTGVTIGTTAPDVYYAATNNGTLYIWPAWKNH